MKHLKLFEDINYYIKIDGSGRGWYDNNLSKIDTEKFKKIESLIKRKFNGEYKCELKSSDKNYRTESGDIEAHYYDIIIVEDLHTNIFFYIYPKKDEYYILQVCDLGGYYKCDQLDGLIKCMKDNEEPVHM